ncbi:putative 18S rRNA (adenine(1779)-N(6)/adenine(1780)-N(6))-dimethyltransferase [Rosa chinensis]|uniref:rRNA adenine N(6)-methyltransferase n=1 Tax=Rosa chinensis TaxID=74649 RepID=A0A2P6RM43_ROSCH|nr:ribosomal RNA small subunit methyltransferase, mitochondrial [Rosa chinensis]PRQ47483.1 putative 18S rRNA (adenine(1779)-N(6)/adenine(1780)-N(6))-dimethyltransferase [Rosa chinensis]
MLRFSSSISRLILKQYPVRLIHARSRNRCYPDGEDDGDKARKREANKDGYFQLYKSKGQHLLTNQRILDSIVRKSDIKPTDTVLEIGPGTGNLTLKLLEAANSVVAFEIDKRMVEVLHKRVAERGVDDRLTVVCEDALKAEFPEFDLVVANIPYGISSPLVAKLVYGERRFRSATLLLQKEFARRLLAKPGDSEFNRLAVNVSLVADVEFAMDVSKREFVPCPKVDSSVVIIRPKAEVPDVNLDEWCAFTKACFGKKNKTLGATFKQKKKVVELLALSKLTELNAETEYYIGSNPVGDEEEECSSACSEMGGASSFKEKLMGVLKSADFENKRPSKLSNDELLHLLALFHQAGIYFCDRSKNTSVVIESFE